MSIENCRIELAEKLVVQSGYSVFEIALGDNEAQIQ